MFMPPGPPKERQKRSSASGVPHRYRPDVDGLRAVAILSVLFFHLNHAIFPGGFVGVDIFFVISGYLITRNIVTELDAGKFTILGFYRRRIKRIVPALMLVIAATLIAAHFLFIPEDAESTAKAALFSILSMANVYFWLFQDHSYFAIASTQIPLLHFWSLGIEEQYYLLWPAALLLVYPRTSTRVLMLGLITAAIASYLLGDILFEWSPLFVYYMLPTRAGELLLGGLLAIGQIRNIIPKPGRVFAHVMSISGLCLIVASLALLSSQSPFPGVRALPSTLGAALLIWAGSGDWKTPISRLLSIRPMVFIGLLSYSAYLWHWPILAFLRYGYAELSLPVKFAAVAATFILAWLTYIWVETPFRHSRKGFLTVFSTQYALPAVVLGAFCVTTLLMNGYRLRPSSEMLEVMRPAYEYDYVCQSYVVTTATLHSPDCVVGAAGAPSDTDIVLWGDSNAAHFIGMIGVFAKHEGYRFRNIAHSSCPPLLSDPSAFIPARLDQKCSESLHIVTPLIRNSKVVIMSASWSSFEADSAAFLPTLRQTIEQIVAGGATVILLGKAPVFPDYDRRCLEKATIYPFLSCGNMKAPKQQSVPEINAKLMAMAKELDDVAYFDVTPYICTGNYCSPFTMQSIPLYYDSEHLSMKGSWNLGREILRRNGVPPAFQYTFIAKSSIPEQDYASLNRALSGSTVQVPTDHKPVGQIKHRQR